MPQEKEKIKTVKTKTKTKTIEHKSKKTRGGERKSSIGDKTEKPLKTISTKLGFEGTSVRLKKITKKDIKKTVDFEDIQVLDKEGKSCSLHLAAAKGNNEEIASLLKAGYNIDKPDSDNATALHHASYRGQFQSVKQLVDSMATINAQDHQGVTALHHAAFTGQLEIVKYLISKKAAINHQDIEGGTALQNACFHGHIECVQVLLDVGADYNIADKDGSTALHYGAFGGNMKVVSALLSQKAVQIDSRDKDGATPLHHAAFLGEIEVCKALINEGAKYNIQDYDGGTPLHSACFNNQKEIVEYLIKLHGVDINTKDKEGSTPLHKSAFMGDLDVVKLLVGLNAEIEAKDRAGATPLHKAAFNGHSLVVTFLLEKKASVGATDARGGTPLHNAIYNGHSESALILINKGADIEARDKNGRTALHSAAAFEKNESMQLLLDNKANVDVQDNNGLSPLHLAAFSGGTLTLALLLDKGALINEITRERKTPLHYAVFKGNMGAVVLLIERGAHVSIQDKKGVTPLHSSILSGNKETVSYLLYKDAKINAQNEEGNTPLHIAVQYDDVELCALLISKKADYDSIHNKEGHSIVDLSLKLAHPDTKEFFRILVNGENPFSSDNKAKWLQHRKKNKDIPKTNMLGIGLFAESKIVKVPVFNKKKSNKIFRNLGYVFDLNDVEEITCQVDYESRKIQRDLTLLNCLRHLLLIPSHFQVGAKVWDIIELFIHGAVLNQGDGNITTISKLTYQEFKNCLYKKDKIDADEKLIILDGIEKGLNVLFSNIKKAPNDFDMKPWEPSEGEFSSDEGDYSSEEDSDYSSEDEYKRKRVKPKISFNKRGEAVVETDAPSVLTEESSDYGEMMMMMIDNDNDYEIGDEEDLLMQPIVVLPPTPPLVSGEIPIAPGAPPIAPCAPCAPCAPPAPCAPTLPPKFNGIKLKRFNWTKVLERRISTSMWITYKDNTKGIVLNEKKLEQLFALAQRKDLSSKKNKKEKKLNLIGLQRANNVGILLTKFDMPFKEIKRAILECDEKVLSTDAARALSNMAPTEQEIELLLNYKKSDEFDPNKLGTPELFFLELMQVPNVHQRLQCFVFMKEFPFLVKETIEAINDSNESMNKLRRSRKLKRVMEVVLVLGNFMNRAYGISGNAKGFEIESLHRLVDTKANREENEEGPSTFSLLNYLVDYLQKVKPILLDWPDEVEGIINGHRDYMNNTVAEAKKIKIAMEIINEELEKYKDTDDPFTIVMGKFSKTAGEELGNIAEQVNNMRTRFDNLCSFYGIDETRHDPVSIIFQFAFMWKEAIATNARVKAAKERAAKKAAANAKLLTRISVRSRNSRGRRRIRTKHSSKSSSSSTSQTSSLIDSEHIRNRRRKRSSRSGRGEGEEKRHHHNHHRRRRRDPSRRSSIRSRADENNEKTK